MQQSSGKRIIFVIITACFALAMEGDRDIASECCQLGRQWAIQSHHLCGPYPAEMMSDAVALDDDVMSAILCISAVDACCVVVRREAQCEAGRQTALNEHSCHGLHLYQSAEDAKECCNCCRLGTLVPLSGRSCDHQTSGLPLTLRNNTVCIQLFTECCQLMHQSTINDDLPDPPGSGVDLDVTNAFTHAAASTWSAARGDGQLSTSLATTTPHQPIKKVCEVFKDQLCAHLCVDTIQSYHCVCHDGFVLLSDGKSCQKLMTSDMTAAVYDDRCQEAPGKHCQQLCVDTGQDIQCYCHEGYVLNYDRRTCQDIDECLSGSHRCPSRQQCVNIPGSYTCSDILIGTTSMGISANNAPTSSQCPDGAVWNVDLRQCESTQAQPGVTTTASITAALLTRELGISTTGCPDGGVWNENSRACDLPLAVTMQPYIEEHQTGCPPGMQYNGRTGKCEEFGNMVEQVEISNQSSTQRASIKSSGRCPIGYAWNRASRRCEDVDECIIGSHSCEPTQLCENAEGSYTCLDEMADFDENDDIIDYSDDHEMSPLDDVTSTEEYRTSTSSQHVVQSVRPLPDTRTTHEAPQRRILTSTSSSTAQPHSKDEQVYGFQQPTGSIANSVTMGRTCGSGYVFSETTGNCKDIDECRGSRVCSLGNQICTNTLGSYTCQCHSGYQLDPETSRCIDVDECDAAPCSPGNRCRNLPGSYRCVRQPKPLTCRSGYRPDSTYGRSCIDIDECRQSEPAVCDGYGLQCINTPGSYRCRCQRGFQLDSSGRQCTDVDECSSSSGRRRVCVGESQTCHNTVGSYECDCLSGFTYVKSRQVCLDIDECRMQTHHCGKLHDCNNTNGSFHCIVKTCSTGHRLNYETGSCDMILCPHGMRPDVNGYCSDIDECAEQVGLCRHNQQCHNTVGSFTCRYINRCGQGYEQNESTGHCEDIDECRTGTHRCLGSDVQCVNRPGTYLCQCPQGYRLNTDYQSCEDIDECDRYSSGQVCPQTAYCQNAPGSFRCVCRDGFEPLDQNTPTSFQCQDVDECQQLGLCHHSCHNTFGSYDCVCHDGYELADDQRICNDIDECQLFATRLTPLCQGVCENTPGSYACTCLNGYQLASDGRTCRDVDECANDVTNCHGPDDFCVNTRGGFRCEKISCPKGFVKSAPTPSVSSIRCQRKTFTCPRGDVECLYAPLSYSANFITLPLVALHVPVDLFTMRGPVSPSRRMQFELKLVSSRDPDTGISAGRVNGAFFDIDQVRPNEAVVKLVHEVIGSQDIELQLNMNVYSREFQDEEIFYGTAVARIFIYITKDPW